MRVPWRDRHGKFLKFKAAVLACMPIPGLVWAYWLIDGDLGGRPVNDVIHGFGSWTVRFLMLALAITPFARILEWPRLLTVRRMVGVTAAVYATVHFSLYIVDQKFNLLTVASEIVLRFYLAIGFVALSGLIALGVTSTDAAMKRMGKRWKQLHRLVYPIGVLALLHFFIQTKANVGEPVFVSGPVRLADAVAFVAGGVADRVADVLRAGAGQRGADRSDRVRVVRARDQNPDPFRILDANWSERFFPRPAHEVAAVVLVVALVITARRWLARRAATRPESVPGAAEANSP